MNKTKQDTNIFPNKKTTLTIS